MPAEVCVDRRRILCCLGGFALSVAALVQPLHLAAQAAQAPAVPAVASASIPTSDAEIEKFLKDGRVGRTKSAGKGVTNSLRATLTDGALTHDAHIQVIDEKKVSGPSAQGTELNFRDSWSFNVAAYRIDRLIGLNLVPVSVERDWRGKAGAYTWWIDDVLMDEGERLKKQTQPPDPTKWSETMQLVRLFDQLILNVDRNMGNLIITKDWRVWAIDHTRAFRLHKTLTKPASVTRCDRKVLEGLKALNAQVLEREVGRYLTGWEREAVLARRDAIVAIIEQGGPGAVFDRKQ
jgi:hypothetical protein